MHKEDQILPLSFSSMKEPVAMCGVLAVTVLALAATTTLAVSTTTSIDTTSSGTDPTRLKRDTTTSERDTTTSERDTTTSGTDETTAGSDSTTLANDTTTSDSDQTTGNDTISSTRSDGNLYLENGSPKKAVSVLVYVTALLLAVTLNCQPTSPGRLIGPADVVMAGSSTEGLASSCRDG
ncbi:autotransporter adhesin BpaC-like isoform X2 [Haliotis rubra]|uniref:autotransporter adhesin BpaC-like isoform X2 n=1 Tax=Haliotis rubra TaxID=36100 RepID=UPI001EE5E593|nr:autotransporter adhesin BpaC-like isoform X2 [Haliotis rubra]